MTRRMRARAARAAGALAAATAAMPAVALAGDPILPFAEVRPGMAGEARTVVEGTAITAFPVRVLDVQHSGDAPGGGLILGRAEGPLMERTGGVAQGMSGSPVYVTGADGTPRVIGALAYGTGDEAGVIVGITPIEQMIGSNAGARQFARPRVPSPPRRAIVRVADRAAATARERRAPGTVALYPLARWTVAGASRPALAPLARSLRAEGVSLSAVGPRTPRPAQDLVPGATMAALISGGDLVLGGIGTVTWTDGPRVVGFGHPFLGGGRSRLLLGDGYVLQTIPAPIGAASYKLAEPGTVRGAVIGDRADGVTAVLGRGGGVPAVSRAVDVDRDARSTVRAVLAPDERLMPLAGGVLQVEPALRARDGLAGGTLRLTVRVTSPALPAPIVHRQVFAAYGDVITPSSDVLPRMLASLTQNGLASIPIASVRVDQRLEAAVRQARLVSARVHPASVRAGQRAVLELRMAPWRAGARTVRVPFRVPALQPGRRVLRVVPNTGAGFDPAPPALEESLGAAAPLARRRAVAAVEARAAGIPGTRAMRVATATRRELGGRNDAVRVLVPGEDALDAAAGRVIGLGHVITGRGVRAVVRVRR